MLTRMSEADEFSGAALVAKDGRVIFKKAWGQADHATGTPNRTDTKFNLASAGKMFTSVAVLQLAQAGKLSLDDTVGQHLPEYANKDVREKVTIRQLLSHKSGLGEMFNAKYKAERENLRTVKAFVSLFENDPLQFKPGTRYSYSNAGFCLLGAIVEKVSGEDYYQYLDKHVFEPAGMHDTGAFETDKPIDNVAIGYTRDGATTPEELRARRDNIKLHVVKGSPAGGGFSTVEDLQRFAAALLGKRLLNDEYTQLVARHTIQDRQRGRCLGIRIPSRARQRPHDRRASRWIPRDQRVVLHVSGRRLCGCRAQQLRFRRAGPGAADARLDRVPVAPSQG